MADYARLTVDDLRTHVPAVQDGPPAAREASQRALLAASEGLVRHWTRAEHQRASMQFPQLEAEDVRQVVVLHLLRAFDAMSLDKLGGSASNWLYHRVTGDTRRELGATHCQVRFSRYFLENARRVKAITSRLEGELSRAPTDAEILAASGEAATTGTRLGPKSRQSPTRKPLSAQFLRTYRENAAAMLMSDMPEDDDLPGADPHAGASQADVAEGLRGLYLAAARDGLVDDRAVDVVFCVFGIDPYDRPRNIAEAAGLLRVPAGTVKAILSGWAAWCATPNSAFHAAVAALDEDTAGELGLGAVRASLGEPAGPCPAPAPPALTAVRTS
jgi:hypothetical protein